MKRYITTIFAAAFLLAGCMKEASNFRELLNNREIIYPGPVNNIKFYQGNLRVKLQWNPSPDPSITNYILYWNNGNDSLLLPAGNSKTSDTVSAIVSGLLEYVQNFTLYTADAKGNRSIGQSVSGVRMYGPLYNSSLTNRLLKSEKPYESTGPDQYTLYFEATDTTLGTGTSLTYLDAGQQLQTVIVDARQSQAVIEHAPAGTKVAVRSSYIPVKNAIDTFRVTYSDTLTLN
ncbi:DUF4998 domain-containing protein [Chitinophaga pollutisoli]|uniref:DUF4998 domain-containing protein n=1 Tax=Chitinophaga pollutisoli TaxID=3133966 RepID=A0ABZ2YP32_9BACT